MADYIYAMETRLTPDQQKAVTLITDVARAHEMNIYLTGGALRDLITGFPIRDIDLTRSGKSPQVTERFGESQASPFTASKKMTTTPCTCFYPATSRAN